MLTRCSRLYLTVRSGCVYFHVLYQCKKTIICRRLASVVAQVLPTVRINGIYCPTTNQAISAALHRPSSTAHHAHTTAVAATGKQQRALKRGHNMYCATTNFRLAGTGTEVSRSSSIAVKRSTQATTDSRRGILPVSFAVKKDRRILQSLFLA